MGRQRLLLGVAIGLVGMLAVYVGAWFWAASFTREKLAAFIVKEGEKGRQITYDRLTTHGFPFVIRIRLDGFAWAAKDAWRWDVGTMHVFSLPHDVRRFVLVPKGAQSVQLDDVNYSLASETLRIGIKGRDYDVEAQGLTIRGGARDIALGSVLAAYSKQKSKAWQLSAAVRGVQYRDDRGHTLNAPLLDLRLRADTKHVAPLTIDAAEIWVDDPGTAPGATDSTALGVLGLSGRIEVDAEGYPIGAIDLWANQLPLLANAARGVGAIGPENAAQVDAALAALTSAQPAGGQRIDLRVSFKDQQAFLGPVALGHLRPIAPASAAEGPATDDAPDAGP